MRLAIVLYVLGVVLCRTHQQSLVETGKSKRLNHWAWHTGQWFTVISWPGHALFLLACDVYFGAFLLWLRVGRWAKARRP